MNYLKFFVVSMVFVFSFLVAFAQADTFDAEAPDTKAFVPSHQLEFGMAGEEVRKLQQLLAVDSALYPEGLVTGYFGSRTRRAVERFQIRHGIVNESDGLVSRTGFGRVGPRTRAKIFEIMQLGGKEGMRLMPQELQRP